MNFNVETVEAALCELYCNAGTGSAAANQYLMAMQGSVQAWDIAWQLLDMAKPVEVQYFGATTLHTKLSRHWHQLPEWQYEDMRTRLLQAVVLYARGPKVVLTKVLVAMASYVVNTIASSWPTAIDDLLVSFRPQIFTILAPDDLLKLLLEMLTVIPEELQSLENSMRGPSRKPLEESSGKILAFLNQLAVMDAATLSCIGSWSQLGFDWEQQTALLPRVMACVRKPELCGPATEVLTTVAGHPDLHRYRKFLSDMVERVVQLEDVIMERLASDDTDSCGQLCRLLVEIVDCHAHSLVSMLLTSEPDNKSTILKLLELLLRCTGTPRQYPIEETWSRHTLPAWHSLQDAVSSFDGSQRESLLLLLQPVWQNLFEALLRKAQLPLDDSQWDSEKKDALRCCRQDIGDCIMSVFDILRVSLLAALGAHLQVAMHMLEKDAKAWPAAEACLLAFQAVAENVRPHQERYLGPQFRAALPGLMAIPHLQPATLSCLGSLGTWLQNPEQLGAVLPILLQGLEAGPRMSVAASLALKDLARDCPHAIIPHTRPLLEATQRLLLGQQLRPRERVRLLSLAGQLLASWELHLSEAWLSVVLDHLLPMLQASAPPEMGQLLHELAALVSGLAGREEPPSLVEPVLARALPVLSVVATRHACDETTIEALCEVAKRAAVSLSPAASEQLLSLLVQLQETCPQASVVEACRSLLLLLAVSPQEPRLAEAAATALGRICNATLVPTAASMSCFHENTALLEAFFQLLVTLARKAATLLTGESVNLSLLFNCAIAAIGLPEKGTVKAAALFLAEVIQQSQQHASLEQVVSAQRMLLVERCLRVVGGGESPRSAVEPMADVVLALTRQNLQATGQCLTELLMQSDFPSVRLTPEHRHRYMHLLLRERTNKRILKEALVEMSLVCRGLVGTEYAAQTAQSLP
ncbi:hypothetical protein V5799_019379 [Amblyomma americanum]|uniref:Importin N-terminal domain-containing protein n=1 Tax=Amblyomma americanum TaxID=6943 RepID=A0AAQ4EX46_AMBAM